MIGPSNTADPGAPGLMTYTTPSAAVTSWFIPESSNRFEAQIIPLYVDSRNEVSEVSVDFVELRVTYRR
jgi:hypothetical protein